MNRYNTTDLVISVMGFVARRTGLDTSDVLVENELYFICADLEDWPETEGFGSSDHFGYILSAIHNPFLRPKMTNDISSYTRYL